MNPVQRRFRSVFGAGWSTAAWLALGIVITSVLSKAAAQLAGLSMFLIPQDVFGHLALWQPVTHLLLDSSPMGIIFSALITWQTGTHLEQAWGSQRMLRFVLGITFVAGLLTLGLAFFVPSLRLFPYGGATVVASVLWVAYGLWIGRGQTGFWGMPVTGYLFAAFGIGFVALNAIYGGWQVVVPEVFALLLVYWKVVHRGATPQLWLRFTSWRMERDLKARSKHLRVVSKEGEGPVRGSDRYLH
jgi:membrane associated rhomboid family serine protease